MIETLDSGLIEEIEAFLRSQIKRTAHPLVSKTTDELVREALNNIPQSKSTDPSPLPGSLWKILPDWMLSARRMVRSNVVFELNPKEHIRLTIAVIERWGWTQGSTRSKSGRRCIAGSQLLLLRLGYGTEQTMKNAGKLIQEVLYARGVSEPYWLWNEHPRRTRNEVLGLLKEAMK